MIQLFRKILCPIDFSEHSFAALEVALKVALQNDSKLYLLKRGPQWWRSLRFTVECVKRFS